METTMNLVRQVAAARREGEAHKAVRRTLIDALATIYPDNVWRDPGTWPRVRRLDAFALALAGGDAAPPEGAEQPIANLLITAGEYRVSSLAAYADARPLLERAVAICEKVLNLSRGLPHVPEELGGPGLTGFDGMLIGEELAWGCAGVATSMVANDLALLPILIGGTDEQKRRYLPDVASGRRLIAFGLSERTAGSDAGSLKTTARDDGDAYVLDGDKKWTTNGGAADLGMEVTASGTWRAAQSGELEAVDDDDTTDKKTPSSGVKTSEK